MRMDLSQDIELFQEKAQFILQSQAVQMFMSNSRLK